MQESEALVRQVCAALEHEPRINLHRYPTAVTFDSGDLTVEGEVEHIIAKKLELAAAVPGVKGIVDRLRVTPAEPREDGAIRASPRRH